jgi:hypothetical protein
MVTFLITSVFVFGLIAIAIYFWQKPAKTSETIELPPPPPPRGMFSDYQPNQVSAAAEDLSALRSSILENARNGEREALSRAHQVNDQMLYEEVLNILTEQANSEAQLLSLISHVVRSDFPVNKNLARKAIEYWRESLDKSSTAKLLHIAALSNDAETYRNALEVVLKSWREGKLPDLSAAELQSLFNGEFWVLSSSTRSSGAGFVLKRTLSIANRELEATNNQS